MSVPYPPPPGVPEEVWSKNRLQQYTQRASLSLPIYQTISEGSPHAPSFRARVWVDGTCFTSPNSFSKRKMAEQDAAKHALTGIREKVKSEGSSRIRQDTVFCKSIINEYAVKLNLTPTYVTNQSEAMFPIFVSSLVLNGVTYVGDAGKSKREAEQSAACSAILSILDSESSTTMSEIVKSKFRFYDALKKVKDLYSATGTVPTGTNSLKDIKDSYEVQAGNISVGVNALEAPVSVNKRKEVHISGVTASSPSTAIPQSGLLTLPPTLMEHAESTLDQPSNAQANVLEAPVSVNKRKEVHASGGTAPSPLTAIPQSILLMLPTTQAELAESTLDQPSNAQANALEAPVSVNKRKEAHVSGGTAPSPPTAIPQSILLSLSTTRVELAESILDQPSNTQANALEAPVSVNKRKEVHVSGGTAPSPLTAIPQSILLTLATTRVELPESTVDQPSNSQVMGQSLHEFKKPKCQTSSAEIAPPIVFVPPTSGQALICSASGKKRNRKNKKAKRKMEHGSSQPVVMIPQSPFPACSVAQ